MALKDRRSEGSSKGVGLGSSLFSSAPAKPPQMTSVLALLFYIYYFFFVLLLSGFIYVPSRSRGREFLPERESAAAEPGRGHRSGRLITGTHWSRYRLSRQKHIS